jgi:hypothetical protein
VIDEFTREALANDVDRGIDADGASSPSWTAWLSSEQRRPMCASTTVPSSWHTPSTTGADSTTPLRYSSIPARHGQNAWIESLNGRLRDELLNSWRSDSLRVACVIIEDWRCDYNANRPHTAHGELTPTEFALQWTMTHQPQSRMATGPPNGSPSGAVRRRRAEAQVSPCRHALLLQNSFTLSGVVLLRGLGDEIDVGSGQEHGECGGETLFPQYAANSC